MTTRKTLITYLAVLFALLTITPITKLHAGELDDRITFDSYSVRDGLSAGSVFAIAQDADNFLWLATPSGLTRFDGYRFEIFNHTTTDEGALPDDNVRSLCVDASGRLWVGTAAGLARFDRGRFVSYPWDESIKGGTLIYDIAPTPDALLLATDIGLLRFDEKNGYRRTSHPAEPVYTLLYSADATLLCGTQSGVTAYHPASDKSEPLCDELAGIRINDLLPHNERSRQIWVATEGRGLWLYDVDAKQMRRYRHSAADASSLSSDYVRSLAYDNYNRLWVGTFVGLNLLSRDEQGFRRILNPLYANDGLSQNSIRSLFADNQGGMWLGTYFGGVNYYHPLKNRFDHFSHHRTEGGLSDRIAGAMAADGDYLWIGTNEGGLNKIHLATGVNRQMRHQEDDPTTVSGNNIKAILRLSDGTLAVGSHDGGLCFGSGDGRFTRIRLAEGAEGEAGVYSLAERTEAGELWVGTLSGLKRYDMQRRQPFGAADSLAGQSLLNGRKLYLLSRDSHSRIWIGTDRGLYLYHPTTKRIRLAAPADNNRTGDVNCFVETADGTLLAGTGKGLMAVDTTDWTLRPASTIGWSETSDCQIYGVYEDAFHRLWMSSNRGLIRLDKQGKTRRIYTEADGVRCSEFIACSHARTPEGRLFFGGVDGVTGLYPERLMSNPLVLSPVITGLALADRKLTPGDDTGILSDLVEHTQAVELLPNQNWIAVEYGSPDYLSGRRNLFAVRLLGLEKDWRTTRDASASYSYLEPGDYTFQVRCANSDGKWSSDIAELQIRVLPYWWQTWWARLLLVGCCVAIFVWLLRYYERRRTMREALAMERREKEQVAELGQMKIRFFINISHELRTPLTLILSPVCEMLERGSNDPWMVNRLSLVRRNAQRMLNLVNQVIDYRRAELGVMDLHPSLHTPAKELREVFDLFVGSAANRRITYEWSCGYDIDEQAAYDGNYLERILTNLIANALKYTPAGGTVRVSVSPADGQLQLAVADTGCGIAPADQARIFDRFYQVDATSASAGAGIGLSFVKLLVERHGGTLRLDSKLGEGSRFEVTIPARREDYPAELWAEAETGASRSVLPETFVAPAPTEETPGASPEETEGAPADAKRETLLIVDDDAEIRNYLCEALGEEYATIAAADGEEAWQLLEAQSEPVALVVADVMMPRIDGLRLCSMIKHNVGYCHIPVVLLTAKVEQGEQLDGLNAGADDYICKPFVLSLLRAKIRNIIRGRKLAIANYAARPEAAPTSIATNTMDEELLSRAVAIVESNIDNEAFTAEQLARDMGMSRSNLHLKLKGVTGESAVALIRRVRLGRACQLLKEGRWNVAEISAMVGLSPAYFSTTFKKYMGCHPSEYAAAESDKTK